MIHWLKVYIICQYLEHLIESRFGSLNKNRQGCDYDKRTALMLACAEGTRARKKPFPKNSCLLDVQLALVSFFLPMEYFSGNPHGKQPELSLHDFDHFRYDFLLKKT